MPRGIPNVKPDDDGETKTISITLRIEDYHALQRLASKDYRTPQLEAGYLLSRVLADSTRNPTDLAQGILARAAQKNGA